MEKSNKNNYDLLYAALCSENGGSEAGGEYDPNNDG